MHAIIFSVTRASLKTNKQLLRSWKLRTSFQGYPGFFSTGNARLNETVHPFDQVCTGLLVENLNQDTQSWMCKRIESTDSRKLSHLDKITALNRLMLVHCFELFLLKEGPLLKAETSFCDCEMGLPAICSIIDSAAKYDIDSFVIGYSQLKMLNVLSKFLNFSMEKLFMSIMECRNMVSGAEIVSYYLNSNLKSKTSVTLLGAANSTQTLCPLSFGVSRALQELGNSSNHDKVWTILCYGANDLADKNTFTNIVQLSNESKCSYNGSIHIVINEAEEDVSPKTESQCKFVKIFADFIKAPIVHVRAEDVDSVVNVMQLAADFRAAYKRDIVIDLITGVTQNYPTVKRLTLPGLVKQLMTSEKPPLAASYLGDLVQSKVIAEMTYTTRRAETLKGLQAIYAKQNVFDEETLINSIPREPETKEQAIKEPSTSSSIPVLNKIGTSLSEKPFSIDLTPETLKLLEERKNQLEENKLSWSLSELLAHGTLLHEGIDVHMSCSRKCMKPNLNVQSRGSGTEKNLLSEVSPYMGNYRIIPSFIPHYAVAGFEAGYSSVMINSLSIWPTPEDIQIKTLVKIMHDYLSCAVKELKTKITFIIPSYIFAMEKNSKVYYSTQTKQIRNIIETVTDNDTHLSISCEVVQVSTPSNLFHILKKQAKSSKLKPLVIFVPFEYHKCMKHYSTLEDLSGETSFQPFIEENPVDFCNVKHIILCSGVVFYDLKKEITKQNLNEYIAIGRIEQLYPLPMVEIVNFIDKLQTRNIWWVQDEQYEDGWWNYVEAKLKLKGIKLKFAGRSQAMQPCYKTPTISEANLSHIFETIANADTSL